ncbi:hypothetical protein ADUPG1_007236 [Aduncisulcus paluster]|uniref:Uncharacterized protein n=1 Tax=Aduncisulcus paluster TaxID=2918883 RepID=A0ABQ5KL90_9EUKA|nr:hypothetical protein ADUPG1_007236 [Aduncisulcus paluster]
MPGYPSQNDVHLSEHAASIHLPLPPVTQVGGESYLNYANNEIQRYLLNPSDPAYIPMTSSTSADIIIDVAELILLYADSCKFESHVRTKDVPFIETKTSEHGEEISRDVYKKLIIFSTNLHESESSDCPFLPAPFVKAYVKMMTRHFFLYTLRLVSGGHVNIDAMYDALIMRTEKEEEEDPYVMFESVFQMEYSKFRATYFGISEDDARDPRWERLCFGAGGEDITTKWELDDPDYIQGEIYCRVPSHRETQSPRQHDTVVLFETWLTLSLVEYLTGVTHAIRQVSFSQLQLQRVMKLRDMLSILISRSSTEEDTEEEE